MTNPISPEAKVESNPELQDDVQMLDAPLDPDEILEDDEPISFFDLGLIPEICQRVETIGYKVPTAIQKEAIPVILDGHDLIGIAQTGTGKTAAFMLPLLDSLICSKAAKHRDRPRVVVMTPTRELAQQILDATKSFSQGSKLRSVVIFGGVSQRTQERELSKGCDIMIGTPGRVNDLINQRVISMASVEFLVLDEADRMLDMGFLPQIKRILAHVPKDRQTMMFSATLSHEIEDLARRTMHDAVMLEVGGRRKPAEGVTQMVYAVMKLRKPELLLKLLKEMERGPTLIFTKTKHDADRVAHVLEHANINVTKLHSDLTQGERTRALADFRSGKFDTLVATDVASRGLDIDDISHVINYEPPMSPDDYVHRVGRTARAEKTGVAITFVSPEEEPMMRDIEKRVSIEIERTRVEGFAPPPPLEISSSERRRLKGWAKR